MVAQFRTYSNWVALIGVVLVVAALGLWAVLRQMSTLSEVLLIVGVVMVAASAFSQPQGIRRVLTGRAVRYGSNALILSLAFIAIIGLLTFLSERHYRRSDLTENKLYSLSDQTLKILAGIKNPIQITIFHTPSDSQDVVDLVKEYHDKQPLITYKIIDPDMNPAEAQAYGNPTGGTLVFASGEQRSDKVVFDEQGITSGILAVTQPNKKGIYFLTGHNERSLDDTGSTGLSRLKSALTAQNYNVASISFVVTDTLPTDMNVLVIANPMRELTPQERQTIGDYINQGGRVLMMQDSFVPLQPGQRPANDVGLNAILTPWQVGFRDDVIIDVSSSLPNDPSSPAVGDITQGFPYPALTRGVGIVVFPLSRSIQQTNPDQTPEGETVNVFAQTSPNSWGETHIDKNLGFDQGEDTKGPLAIGVVAEHPVQGDDNKKSRIALIGNSTFATNQIIGSIPGNQDMALNTISWLAEEEQLISIGPKTPTERSLLGLTSDNFQVIWLSSIVFLPLTILAAGAIVWWRRR
ncbi:MAG: GldG family protein [Chloroflexi bacterium]|nr:GldG family protein [Chloroflexota bacterium]